MSKTDLIITCKAEVRKTWVDQTRFCVETFPVRTFNHVSGNLGSFCQTGGLFGSESIMFPPLKNPPVSFSSNL